MRLLAPIRSGPIGGGTAPSHRARCHGARCGRLHRHPWSTWRLFHIAEDLSLQGVTPKWPKGLYLFNAAPSSRSISARKAARLRMPVITMARRSQQALTSWNNRLLPPEPTGR